MKDKATARVNVTLAPTLRQLGQLPEGPEAFEVRASTPLECLQITIGRYPSIKKWACKDGNLLPVIWFFVNDPDWKKKLTPDELGNQLKDGDEVIIAFGKL